MDDEDKKTLIIALARYKPEPDREEKDHIICQFCKHKAHDIYFWDWTVYPHAVQCPVVVARKWLDSLRDQPPLDDRL